MWVGLTGENAGRIWHTLHDAGKLNISQIRKATKLEDRFLYMALGWLAREGKVTFAKEGREILVGLTHHS